eukprot:SAG22_NODE_213_length_15041_cov_3.683732_13_plen_611_part_00
MAAADRPAAAAAGVCWNGEVKAMPQPADEAACISADASYVWIGCYSVSTWQAAPEFYMCDRAYVFDGEVPAYLSGIAAIKTANSDKASDRADTDFLCFDIDVPGTVYVLYDSRAVNLPAWLEHTYTNQHATVAAVTDGVGAYNVYFACFPAGTVCMGGNFETSAEEAEAYAACYDDSWTEECDSIGDPPGEGSMYVVAVGPLATHSDINLDGQSFAREIIDDVEAGDGTVSIEGMMSCGDTVEGMTLSSDVSNLGRTETAEKVYMVTLSEGEVMVSSCGSDELFDTTISIYLVEDGFPVDVTSEIAAISIGGEDKTATRVAYHDGTGSSCGHLAEVTTTIETAGDYLIVIDGWPNGNPDQRHGSYSLSLTCGEGAEPQAEPGEEDGIDLVFDDYEEGQWGPAAEPYPEGANCTWFVPNPTLPYPENEGFVCICTFDDQQQQCTSSGPQCGDDYWGGGADTSGVRPLPHGNGRQRFPPIFPAQRGRPDHHAADQRHQVHDGSLTPNRFDGFHDVSPDEVAALLPDAVDDGPVFGGQTTVELVMTGPGGQRATIDQPDRQPEPARRLRDLQHQRALPRRRGRPPLRRAHLRHLQLLLQRRLVRRRLQLHLHR